MNAAEEFLAILNSVEESDPLFNMHYTVPGAVEYPHARIATDLVPKADEHLKGNSEILIVGNDGENVTSECYPWTNNLKDWVKRGNTIKYLLVNPTQKAIDQLREVCNELIGTKGSLEVLTINRELSIEKPDEEFIKRWISFHFVTFDNPKQLWVEENHPPSSTEATDCTYYPPSIAGDVALWGILKRQFEIITSKYGLPVTSSLQA